uniref:Uncharacterized protein n=1 Tax=Manihot esculenta TaxID=3983 RepID=A0A2C9WBQ8_MANES
MHTELTLARQRIPTQRVELRIETEGKRHVKRLGPT